MEPNLSLAAQKKEHSSDEEEETHFQQVCSSYQQYATFHQTIQQGVNHRIQRMLDTSSAEQDVEGPTVASIMPPTLMSGCVENQRWNKCFCDATVRNQFFLDCVLKYSGVPTSQEALQNMQQNNLHIKYWATEDQMSKVDSVLKSVARDWSVEGMEERSVVYDRILRGLDRYLPLRGGQNDNQETSGLGTGALRVAVPGSGLGRLAWEIHAKGYTVQGSDFSLPMLLASDFILNGCAIPDNDNISGEESSRNCRQFVISPWIAETKNVKSFHDRVRTVTVPDVDPSSIQNMNEDEEAELPQFSMLAGEFLSLYSSFLPCNKQVCTNHSHNSHESQTDKKFHAIACSFFLDTAPSLPEYLITIYHMLEDGGLLLHFGPLMYHWSGHGALLPKDLNFEGSSSLDDVKGRYQRRNSYLDPRYMSSVDFTWSEVRQMILNTGFEVLEEELNIPALYTSNVESMMEVCYKSVFLVARKKVAS